MVTSGVASFSTYRCDRSSQPIGVASPHCSISSRAYFEIGANGIVVDLAALDDRDAFVEKSRQLAKDPALGLAPESQQDEVVPRQQSVDQLGRIVSS